EMLDELPRAHNPKVRLLQISNIAATSPQINVFDSWKECNPASAKGFSAIGYFIGKQLAKELDLPIGIINSSWGGTPAELWTPAKYIVIDQEFLMIAKAYKSYVIMPNE